MKFILSLKMSIYEYQFFTIINNINFNYNSKMKNNIKKENYIL